MMPRFGTVTGVGICYLSCLLRAGEYTWLVNPEWSMVESLADAAHSLCIRFSLNRSSQKLNLSDATPVCGNNKGKPGFDTFSLMQIQQLTSSLLSVEALEVEHISTFIRVRQNSRLPVPVYFCVGFSCSLPAKGNNADAVRLTSLPTGKAVSCLMTQWSPVWKAVRRMRPDSTIKDRYWTMRPPVQWHFHTHKQTDVDSASCDRRTPALFISAWLTAVLCSIKISIMK